MSFPVVAEPTDAPADSAAPVEPEPDVVALAADEGESALMPGADGGAQPEDEDPDAEGDHSDVHTHFHIPTLVIEGAPTSDRREIKPGALSWRTPPITLRATKHAAHGNMPTTDPVVIGRIDHIERRDVGGEPDGRGGIYADGTTALAARGTYDTSPEAQDFARMIHGYMNNGVSADIGDASADYELILDDDGEPVGERETLTSGELLSATNVPMPAFAGCYIVCAGPDGSPMAAPGEALADMAAQASAPDGGEEGMTAAAPWRIVDTAPPGARRCLPCEQGQALVASAGPMEPPTAWFVDPQLAELTPLTLTADGRIFGHLAAWGTCHTGISGQCVTPPRGGTYAHYRVGSVLTAEGDQVPTGTITLGTGHAPTSGRMSAADVMRHYDDTGTAVADVAAGEDAHGVWIAGAMRPDVTELQVRQLRGSALSGDWRLLGGRLQLVAALAVNTPGFPVPRALAASGTPVALVAAGAAPLLSLARRRTTSSVDLTVALDEAAVAALREHREAIEGVAYRIEQVELRTKARRLRESIHRPAAA